MIWILGISTAVLALWVWALINKNNNLQDEKTRLTNDLAWDRENLRKEKEKTNKLEKQIRDTIDTYQKEAAAAKAQNEEHQSETGAEHSQAGEHGQETAPGQQ